MREALKKEKAYSSVRKSTNGHLVLVPDFLENLFPGLRDEKHEYILAKEFEKPIS